MTCGCGMKAIYNEVAGKGFYYCRECKKEIEIEVPKTAQADKDPSNVWDDFFNWHGYASKNTCQDPQCLWCTAIPTDND